MTEDLMERLQPHIDNPELRRREQEEATRAEREEQEKKGEEKQKRIAEMIREIKGVATAIREILQNPCSITIAKKMQNKEGKDGMVNATIWSSKERVSVMIGGFSFENSECLERGLKIIANQKSDLIVEGLNDSCVEILHNFLSTDNVKVIYE